MYTSENIREIEFPKAGFSGYKSVDVDVFIEEIAKDLEALENKNAELTAKIRVLAENIEEYRETEDTVKSAILTAQKAAEGIIKEAQAKGAELIEEKTRAAEQLEITSVQASEKLMNESQSKAREILDDATVKAKKMIADADEYVKNSKAEAERRIGQELLTYNYIKDEIKGFKESIVAAYKSHIEALSNVPESSKKLDAVKVPEPPVEQISEPETETEPVSEPEEPVVDDASAISDEPIIADNADDFVPAEQADEEPTLADID